jgi:DNA-binding CsgD family transcriptional regulator/tetratricopeptide (TPR) repeat protein
VRVPPHLLLAERNADGWVVGRLREAAASMLTQSAPATAAVFLERALAEPAASSERPSLGLEFGRALGLSGDLDAAAAALRDALVLVDPVAGATISMELGRVLRFAGRIPEAVTVLDAAVAHLPDGHHDEHVALEAEIAIASHMGLPAKEWIDRLASVVDHAQGSSLPDRTVRSMFGYVAACTGTRTGAQVAQIARSAIAEHRDEQDPPLILQSVGAGLAMSGAYAEALAVLDRALAGSQARGDAAEFGFVSLTRTWVAHRSGRVLEGEADARAILAIPSLSPIYGTFAAAHVVFALIERGDLDEADRVLVEHDVADGAIPDTIAGAVILMARGRLHRVRGRTRESVTDFDRCREVVEQIGFTGPALGEWRTDQALAQLAASERELALATAVEEEGLSRSFGVPRELGIALRTRGLVEGGHRGLELLADSVDVLAVSEAMLEHAKSLVEHGAALRRAGKNVPAADQLRQGLDLASRCGAIAVAARARDELITAGGRPRRERLRGPDSLTASELRVARMAAEGRSNPEIAQALFVTRRTVEVHLTHVYRKLEISSRGALASALAPDAD